MSIMIGLVLIAAILWLWQSSLRARETAVRAARGYCQRLDSQLLDETVALHRLGWQRRHGRLHLRREYVFEFTHDGANRSAARLWVIAGYVEGLAGPEGQGLH